MSSDCTNALDLRDCSSKTSVRDDLLAKPAYSLFWTCIAVDTMMKMQGCFVLSTAHQICEHLNALTAAR